MSEDSFGAPSRVVDAHRPVPSGRDRSVGNWIDGSKLWFEPQAIHDVPDPDPTTGAVIPRICAASHPATRRGRLPGAADRNASKAGLRCLLCDSVVHPLVGSTAAPRPAPTTGWCSADQGRVARNVRRMVCGIERLAAVIRHDTGPGSAHWPARSPQQPRRAGRDPDPGGPPAAQPAEGGVQHR